MNKKFSRVIFALVFSLVASFFSPGIDQQVASADPLGACFKVMNTKPPHWTDGNYQTCSKANDKKLRPKNIKDMSKVYYHESNPKRKLNNSISYVNVSCERGYKMTLTLYDKAGYKGKSRTFHCGDKVSHLGAFNNKASSLKVTYSPR